MRCAWLRLPSLLTAKAKLQQRYTYTWGEPMKTYTIHIHTAYGDKHIFATLTDDELEESLDLLHEDGIPVLGVVVNN